MERLTCYDVTKMILESANNRFKDSFKPNDSKEAVLKDICDKIDLLEDDFNTIAYDIEINDDTKDITISIYCKDIVIDNFNSSPFNIISGSSKRVSFKYDDAIEEDAIVVSLLLPGIWDEI